MKKYPWKLEVGENATIRFLDDKPSGSMQWFKIYPLEIPKADVEMILMESPEIVFDYPTNRTIVILRPEVKEWCIENLKGSGYPFAGDSFKTAYVREKTRLVDERQETYWTVEFQTENDALLFKLRWIGCTDS